MLHSRVLMPRWVWLGMSYTGIILWFLGGFGALGWLPEHAQMSASLLAGVGILFGLFGETETMRTARLEQLDVEAIKRLRTRGYVVLEPSEVGDALLESAQEEEKDAG